MPTVEDMPACFSAVLTEDGSRLQNSDAVSSDMPRDNYVRMRAPEESCKGRKEALAGIFSPATSTS